MSWVASSQQVRVACISVVKTVAACPSLDPDLDFVSDLETLLCSAKHTYGSTIRCMCWVMLL